MLFEISCIQRYYTNTRGQGRMLLITMKEKSHPHTKCRGDDNPLSWCIDTIVSSSSLSLFPCPCHYPCICCFFPSSLAFLLPISTQWTAACDGSWGSGGGDGHLCPCLPLVIVLVTQLEVLSHCLLFCCCFPHHCPPCRQWCGHRVDDVVEDGGWRWGMFICLVTCCCQQNTWIMWCIDL